MKTCCKCKLEQPLEAFAKNRNAKDGHEWMCKECRKERNQTPHTQTQRKQWRKDNKEYMKEYVREHYQQNKQDYINQSAKWQKTDAGRAKARISSLLNYQLKKLGQSKENNTSKLLGYSAKQLKEHLDNLGMNWDTDHIDHKIPFSWFKPNTPVHIINDLRNLQPLDGDENRDKKHFYAHPVDEEYYKIAKPFLKQDLEKREIVRIFTL